MRAWRPRSSTRSILILAALLAAPPAASADDSIQTYQVAVARGARAFQDGNYSAARRLFQIAYQVHQEPVLLFNIASTYRRQGKRELALRFYERFLEQADEKDSLRALAVKTVSELEAELAPPPSEETTARPVAGRAVLAPVTASAEKDDDGHPGRALKWAGVGAGAAALASFALAWRSARQASAAQEYIETLPADQAWDRPQADAYQDGEAASRRALIFAVAGGALAATGVVLFTVGHRQSREASVSPAPTAGGGGLVLSGRF